MKKNDAICSETHHDDAVTRAVRARMPKEETYTDLSSFFRVFSDTTRLKVLIALSREELCVCDLSEILGMTKSRVSHQLSVLRAAHLVTFRREGKKARYALADDHVRLIIECAKEHIEEE